MSNHTGSYILNEILREVIGLDMLAALSDQQVERLIRKIWELCWKYDCNWGEIIDESLAGHLGVCRSCGDRGMELNKDGYCAECSG